MNGYALVVDAAEAERFLIDQVIVARSEIATITEWIERHVRAR